MKNSILTLLSIILFNSAIAQDCNCDKVIAANEQYIDGIAMKALPGDTICIMAGKKTQLRLTNFNGTKENPIYLINCGGEVIVENTTFPYVISIGNSSYFRFTGTGDANIKYGIKAIGSTGNGISMGDKSTNFEVDHLELVNNGFAGIMAKTDPRCDLSTNKDNFVQYNTIIHDNYIHESGGEGLYIGNSFFSGYKTTCNGIADTIYPHELKTVRIYNNIVENAHWDGIQVGCATEDCEIFNNTIINYGTTATYAQNNGIQIGGGTTGKCYNNHIENGTGSGIIIFGLGGNDFYNNVIINSGLNYFPGDKTKKVFGIYCDDRKTIEGSSFNFYNNTVVNSKTDGICLVSKISKDNKFYNNLIINPGSLGQYTGYSKQNSYINVGAVTGVSAILSNNLYASNFSTLNLTDTIKMNLHLTTSSPAINAGLDLTSYGINVDFDNVLRPQSGKFDIGAFEYNANTQNSIQSTKNQYLKILPNPANEYIEIYISDSSRLDKVELIDLNGKTVQTIKKPTNRQLSISNLQSGVYIVKCYSGSVFTFEKLIKY